MASGGVFTELELCAVTSSDGTDQRCPDGQSVNVFLWRKGEPEACVPIKTNQSQSW